MSAVEIVYYVDVLSSWCTVADYALEQIEQKYGDDVRVDWRIAQLFNGGPLPYSVKDLRWYYERTRKMTGVTLNADWVDTPQAATAHANQAAEALRQLGFEDSRIRRALSRAALLDAKPLGRRSAAIDEAARLSGVSAAELERTMESGAVRGRIAATTAEYKALGVSQLPAFVIRDSIDDKAVLSGLYTLASLDAVVAEMVHASQVTGQIGPLPA
jgi:predicted DsbA family dithiol-disulfide isomerase